MKRVPIITFVFLLLFISELATAQEYRVVKNCKAYYKPLEDLPDSVIAARKEPQVDPDAAKGSHELLPVTTRVQRLEGTYVYRIKVLTGLFEGRLLYVKKEFLQPI